MIVHKGITSIFALLLLISVGYASQSLLKSTWEDLRERRFASLEKSSSEANDGLRETVLSILGSFRFFIADLSFLNAHYHWQEQRHDEANLWHSWATDLDPDNLFFWQVRIRVIGRDTPVWAINQIGWFPDVDPLLREEIFTQYAEIGIRVVEEALRFHPNDVSLWMDKGLFYEMRLKEYEKAADAFLIAWNLDKSFLPSGLMYLEMLRRLDQRQLAKEFLLQNPQIEARL